MIETTPETKRKRVIGLHYDAKNKITKYEQTKTDCLASDKNDNETYRAGNGTALGEA